MAASGKDSNTVMHYEQTLFYEKKRKKLPFHWEAFSINPPHFLEKV